MTPSHGVQSSEISGHLRERNEAAGFTGWPNFAENNWPRSYRCIKLVHIRFLRRVLFSSAFGRFLYVEMFLNSEVHMSVKNR